MVWNIAPECISLVFLSIIWIYSRKGNITPSLKNRIFQLCFLITFLAMASNILSTLTLYNLNQYTILPSWICNSIYFVSTPLMGYIYYIYVLASIYDDRIFPRRMLIATSIPAIFYILLILINPWTHWIYELSVKTGYQHGELISSTYIIFYLYCLFCICIVVTRGKYVDRTARTILFSFPLIAALVILVQTISGNIILTGSAATIALLMIYLYMQNKQISIDHLTQLPNRQELLNMLKIRLKKDLEQTFAVVILSLREFKRINDVFGQQAGDAFLIEVTQFIKNDLGLNKQRLFRYSGDEFAILLTYDKEQELQEILTKIQARMLNPWSISTCTCMLYGALGIVEYPKCADTIEQIINGIEFSINLAKHSAASNYSCFCTKEILHKVHRRQQIAEVLREQLEQRSFELYYQPIYTIESKNFLSAEALLRIPNSALGPLYPDEFIPVAQESGLIIDITYMVLDEVCHTIQHCEERGLHIDSINVNFSASQFLQPDLIEKVNAILKEHDVDGSMIKIEITESTLAENAEIMLEYVKQMQSYGMKLALDDFGTGYSNITSVFTFPIDTIKLDKSLVYSAMKNEQSAKIVENLSKSFKDLGYSVLAEGVETNEQSEFVAKCGCTLIQGYLYAKPMPQQKFFEFLKDHS